MDTKGKHRMTVHTLRWIYGNHYEDEFIKCTTIEELKSFIWLKLQPLFAKEKKKIFKYSPIVKKESTFTNDAIYTTVSIKDSITSFKKGIAMVDFTALLEYAKKAKGLEKASLRSE